MNSNICLIFNHIGSPDRIPTYAHSVFSMLSASQIIYDVCQQYRCLAKYSDTGAYLATSLKDSVSEESNFEFRTKFIGPNYLEFHWKTQPGAFLSHFRPNCLLIKDTKTARLLRNDKTISKHRLAQVAKPLAIDTSCVSLIVLPLLLPQLPLSWISDAVDFEELPPEHFEQTFCYRILISKKSNPSNVIYVVSKQDLLIRAVRWSTYFDIPNFPKNELDSSVLEAIKQRYPCEVHNTISFYPEVG